MRWVISCYCAALAIPALGGDGEEFFEARVRPVLVEKCLRCHGGEEKKSGLEVDSRAALLGGGKRGPAIVPGDPGKSLLVQAVRRSRPDLKMPPQERLPDAAVADIERWVREGAVWPAGGPRPTNTSTRPALPGPRAPDDPALKANLQLWLKADGGALEDGQPVHLWEDSSGHGRDLAATRGARRGGIGGPARFVAESAIHGHPAVRFEAESGLASSPSLPLESRGDAELTLVVVADLKPNPAAGNGILLGVGDAAPPTNPGRPLCAGIGIGHTAPDQLTFFGGFGNDAGLGAGSFRPLYDRPHILAVTRRRGPYRESVHFSIDGDPAPGEVWGSSQPLDLHHRDDLEIYMGQAQRWAGGVVGDIAEAIIYDRALEDDLRAGVEAHLSAKYSIPLPRAARSAARESARSAAAASHWSFQPVKSSDPPPDPEGWSGHPIDRFIAQRWREKGLRPVGPAGKRELLRRLHFDLTGLPPSPAEAQAFLADPSPAAFRECMERLLASPRYGERWGRYWMDVVRYADTAGDNADYPIPEARLYRDYIIDSFNADKPYDRFIEEQLAGDLLAREGPREEYASRVSATGFLALSRRYATGPYEFWHLTLEDAIDTVGQSILGLTVRCARCHDHKFDPITTSDYYALYGIFESTRFPWPGAEELESKKLPRQRFVSLLPPAEAAARLGSYRERIEALRKEIAAAESALAGQRDEARKKSEDALARKKAELLELERPGLPADLPGACAVEEGIPRHAAVQVRGNPEEKGPVVARGAPAFLTGGRPLEIPEGQSGRLQLARWLTRADHPLTARVMVNRIWQHHFGRGLVATPSNFGLRGAEPTHRELLDYLADRFVKSGWSVKEMHRLILTSKTWQLSSDSDEADAAKDTGNDFYWRHDRLRLDAEGIRDSMLLLCGRLDLSRPGPHPFPPMKDWHWTQHNQFKAVYPTDHRSVYLMTQRLQRHPFLGLFDGPDTNATTEKRASSTVATQALYLMNSPQVEEMAAGLARRLLSAPGSSWERLDLAHRLAYSRPASEEELARGQAYLARYVEGLAEAGGPADRREEEAWTSYARVLLSSNEFFHVD